MRANAQVVYPATEVDTLILQTDVGVRVVQRVCRMSHDIFTCKDIVYVYVYLFIFYCSV